MNMHKRYFENIYYNTDPSVRLGAMPTSVLSEVYEKALRGEIENGIHVQNAAQLLTKQENGKALVLWYDADFSPLKEKAVQSFALEFGIWHQITRSAHKGMHKCVYNENVVFIINVFKPNRAYLAYMKATDWWDGYKEQTPYAPLRPTSAKVFSPSQLVQELRAAKLSRLRSKK